MASCAVRGGRGSVAMMKGLVALCLGAAVVLASVLFCVLVGHCADWLLSLVGLGVPAGYTSVAAALLSAAFDFSKRFE